MNRYKNVKNRNKTKIGSLLSVSTVCIVLIACFALLGASYASWSQSFNVFGTITTGDLDVIVRDVELESSDEYESMSFSATKTGNTVDEVLMDVVTEIEPFGAVLKLTIENLGTIPVICTGIDNSSGDVDITILGNMPRIEPGQTASL